VDSLWSDARAEPADSYRRVPSWWPKVSLVTNNQILYDALVPRGNTIDKEDYVNAVRCVGSCWFRQGRRAQESISWVATVHGRWPLL